MATTFTDALAALRPLATKHATADGERVGFLMRVRIGAVLDALAVCFAAKDLVQDIWRDEYAPATAGSRVWKRYAWIGKGMSV